MLAKKVLPPYNNKLSTICLNSHCFVYDRICLSIRTWFIDILWECITSILYDLSLYFTNHYFFFLLFKLLMNLWKSYKFSEYLFTATNAWNETKSKLIFIPFSNSSDTKLNIWINSIKYVKIIEERIGPRSKIYYSPYI